MNDCFTFCVIDKIRQIVILSNNVCHFLLNISSNIFNRNVFIIKFIIFDLTELIIEQTIVFKK
ncbi:hypothetical protein MEPL12_2c00240 [Melissococcus plutonius]|nr:hypothetical protein MEPL12_2c00240 [Melissococcus plutonius]